MNPLQMQGQVQTHTASEELLARATRSLAGGDSSTMRVLPYHLPLVAQRGEGSRVWDADNNEFIDLNMAYGPLIFGHCPRRVVDAVCEQVRHWGSQLGFPTEISTRVAEKVKVLFPGMELLRFANSGTEAMVSAIRLARTFTGRPTVIQFEGHYHGWGDPCFNRYHAALDELPEGDYQPAIPGTTGMNGAPRDLLVARWNDIDALCRCMDEHAGSVAAVLMEPVMGNAGVIPPREGYLQAVREATLERGVLLIFDEVITGMRVAAGGAQQHYGVGPDITVLSKALGGGYPVAAFGASAEIMQPIVDGTLFHGGVYSGNAVVMAAAEAVLDQVLGHQETMYRQLHEVADDFADQVRRVFDDAGVPCVVQNVGPMVSLFLTTEQVSALSHYREVRRFCDFEKYKSLQHRMQRTGVYFHPNQFEPMFLSTAHTHDDMQRVVEALENALPWIDA
jgi:glutamate-1-semialdehyde 2,1-aminomutase